MHDPNGRVLATSHDGAAFTTSDGLFFAERIGDVFQMADGSTGTLVGLVIFMPNDEGVQTRAFWLDQSDE